MEQITAIDLRLMQLDADLQRLVKLGLIEPEQRTDGQTGFRITDAGRAELAARA